MGIECVDALSVSWTLLTVVAKNDSAVDIEFAEALSVIWTLVTVAVVGSWAKLLLML